MGLIERHLSDGEIVALRDGVLADRRLLHHMKGCPACRLRLGEARLRDTQLRNPNAAALTHPDPLELAAYAEAFVSGKRFVPARRAATIHRHLEDCFECRTIVETAPAPGDADLDVTVTAEDALRPGTLNSLVHFLTESSPRETSDDEDFARPRRSRESTGDEARSAVLSAPTSPSAADFGNLAPHREETLDLGTLQVWVGVGDEACTFAYLPSAPSSRRRPSRSRGSRPDTSRQVIDRPRWWEEDWALREKLEEIERGMPRGDAHFLTPLDAGPTYGRAPAPIGAMRTPSENRVELGLGTAGWLAMTARRRGSGVWMAIERPTLLARCPLTLENGRSDRFDEPFAPVGLSVALGRHTLRSLDPSRDENVLLQLQLDIREQATV